MIKAIFGRQQFMCPFCIREYPLKEVAYVCPICKEKSIPTFLKSVLPEFLKNALVKCKTEKCMGSALQRLCPLCEKEIPSTALDTPNLPFSIVGVSNSGKTNYITVMIQELKNSFGIRLALGGQNRETRDHQNKNYRRIYEEHVRPESTAAGESMPQIWYIKNLLRQSKKSVPTYTFTIFDGAGEDHENNLETSSEVCRYINASKAIILVLDPLILSNVRRGGFIDSDVMQYSLTGGGGAVGSAVDVVNSLATYIKVARGIKDTQILEIPIAVVLTKFDTILSHPAFAPGALIKNSSLNFIDNKVNMSEIQQVDQEIRSWLEEIGEGAFINALEANFNEFSFFGVSSYGSSPKDLNLPNEIRPHRVLDPILWLFKKADFID